MIVKLLFGLLLTDDDQNFAKSNADDSTNGDGKNCCQSLSIEGQGNCAEQDRDHNQNEGNPCHQLQHNRAAGNLERTFGIRINLTQLQECGEDGQIAHKEQDQVQSEEGPEQFGFGSNDGHDNAQNTNDSSNNAVDDGGANGHVVLGPALGEGGGHVAVLSSVASSVVDTQRPRNHVAEQSDHEQQGNSGNEDAFFSAAHNHNSLDQAGSSVNFISRDAGTDAEAGEQVNGSDNQTADNDCLRNFLLGVLHVVGEGADNFEAEHVEDDNGDKGQAVNVEAGQESREAHVINKAVLDDKVNAHTTNKQSQTNLDNGTDVQDDDTVTDGIAGDDGNDEDKAKLQSQTQADADLNAKGNSNQVGDHNGKRSHPKGEVQPVPPRSTGTPAGSGVSGADPVIKAAVTLISSTQLRGDQAIGEQECDDHEQPPEELAVAENSNRGGCFRDEDDADDSQNNVGQFDFFLHTCLQLLFYI